MSSDLIPITLEKILQSKLYTLFILQGPGKRFGIYAEPKVGEIIQSLLDEKKNHRPHTHELIDQIFKGLDITGLQGVIYDVQEGIFFSQLYIQQKKEEKNVILELDSRPSDCLTIALLHNLPLYCKKGAFEKVEALDQLPDAI